MSDAGTQGIMGVLLAAGRGRRMGQAKQLLPWPPGDVGNAATVVSASFDAIAPHCHQVIVVLGAKAAAVASALGPRTFRTVHADPDAEMFESIKLGLRAVTEVSETAAAMVHPADQPAVRSQTVRMLLHEFEGDRGRAVMPEFEGKGGHPAIIPASLFPLICDFEQPGGLRQFWKQRPETCIRIGVLDPGVRLDLNRPEDYRNAAVESM